VGVLYGSSIAWLIEENMTFRNRVIEYQKGYAEIRKILMQAWEKFQQSGLLPDEWMENILDENVDVEEYDGSLQHYKFSNEWFGTNEVTVTGIAYRDEDVSIEVPYEAFDHIDLWIAKKLDEQKASLQTLHTKNEAKKLADNEDNEKRERELYERLKEKFEP
jgi:hypothetical protein